jgi:hypothetical protein
MDLFVQLPKLVDRHFFQIFVFHVLFPVCWRHKVDFRFDAPISSASEALLIRCSVPGQHHPQFVWMWIKRFRKQ